MKLLEQFKEHIYGYILRSLSFQHTDNYIKKTYIFFNLLLKKGLFPDEIKKYLFMYLIHTHNVTQNGAPSLEGLMEYTSNVITATKTEFQFLKRWKQKIL